METYIQLSLFGKTSPELFPATTGRISESSWKSLRVSRNQTLQYLDLTSAGEGLDTLRGMDTAWHGEPWTLNTGESPSTAVESRLSWILEANAPEKYYLSAKACRGILNRASRRGKALPKALHDGLLDMIARGEAQVSTDTKA